MALTGVAGPDRPLYGLAALLQHKLPSYINARNQSERAVCLLIPTDNTGTLSFAINNIDYSIAITTNIVDDINNSGTPLSATKFSYGILLQADSSFKILNEFGNLRSGQIINYQPLVCPKSFIISGVLPGEDQLKAFPAIVLTLNTISPEPDNIVVEYGVDLSLAITSPINSSQADYLSHQLLKYYDCIRDAILSDNGSLGGLVNGVVIDNASISEASGQSNFLKILTISLTISVEED